MSPGKRQFTWLSGVATVFSLLACYGTLLVVALLGALGVSIVLNETLWAGAIMVFAVLAVGGLTPGLLRHRKAWPILVAGTGAGVLGYVMYVQYDRMIELAGFALLCIAAFWDWRLRHAFAPVIRTSE